MTRDGRIERNETVIPKVDTGECHQLCKILAETAFFKFVKYFLNHFNHCGQKCNQDELFLFFQSSSGVFHRDTIGKYADPYLRLGDSEYMEINGQKMNSRQLKTVMATFD